MGLRRFAALAHDAGLLVSRDVRLYGPTSTRLDRGEAGALALEQSVNGDRLSDEALMAAATTQRLSDLAAAASLRTELPTMPTARLGRSLALDETPAQVAAVLKEARSQGVEVLALEGLSRLTREQASTRLASLSSHDAMSLSIDSRALSTLETAWSLSAADLPAWLVAHRVCRITGVSPEAPPQAYLGHTSMTLERGRQGIAQ